MKKISLLCLTILLAFSCANFKSWKKRGLASTNSIQLTDDNCDRFLDSRSQTMFGEGALVCFPKAELLDEIENIQLKDGALRFEIIPAKRVPSYIKYGGRVGLAIYDRERNWTQMIRAYTHGEYAVSLKSGAEEPSFPYQCHVSHSGANRMSVPVMQTMGLPPEQKTEYADQKVAVGFSPGGPFEGQQLLSIEVNGYISQIYDPEKSLYKLTSPQGIEVQCYRNQ